MEQRRPGISLDLKKGRIRIHKNTLHLLNDPCYIQFLVNPEQRTIVIKVCKKEALLAHRINYKSSADVEFYSKELTCRLRTVSGELLSGQTYRLYGEVLSDKGIALFHMDGLSGTGGLDGQPQTREEVTNG